jgi:hypothetical protein
MLAGLEEVEEEIAKPDESAESDHLAPISPFTNKATKEEEEKLREEIRKQ